MLERRGGGQRLQVLLCLRGMLEHAVPAGSELLLWTEAARFGGSEKLQPLKQDTVQLKGSAVAVIRLPAKD